MMRKLLIAALALSVAATPALAQLEPARWGMKPEEVIALVPGAKPFDLMPPQRVTYDVLVDATTQDGGIEFWTHYYFKHPEQTLGMIRSMMNDPRHCGRYRDILVSRLGKGRIHRIVRTDNGWKQRSIQTIWIDQSIGQITNFAITFTDKTEREYSECELTLISRAH